MLWSVSPPLMVRFSIPYLRDQFLLSLKRKTLLGDSHISENLFYENVRIFSEIQENAPMFMKMHENAYIFI